MCVRCQLCSNAEVKDAFLTCVLLIWCLIGDFGFTNQCIEMGEQETLQKKKGTRICYLQNMRSVPAKFGGVYWDQHSVFFIWSVCLCEVFCEGSPPFVRGAYWCRFPFLSAFMSSWTTVHIFLSPSLTWHGIMAVKHTKVLLWKIQLKMNFAKALLANLCIHWNLVMKWFLLKFQGSKYYDSVQWDL